MQGKWGKVFTFHDHNVESRVWNQIHFLLPRVEDRIVEMTIWGACSALLDANTKAPMVGVVKHAF